MELVNIEPLILGESQEGGSAVSMFLLVDWYIMLFCLCLKTLNLKYIVCLIHGPTAL
jgi:hypothetical protein